VITEAEVLSTETRSGEAGTFYRTGFRYVDVDGADTYVTKSIGVRFAVGNRVTLVYDPENPGRVDLAEAVEGWSPGRGLFALGRRWFLVLIFAVPGVLMILFPFGEPICDDPTFRDMDFCVEART